MTRARRRIRLGALLSIAGLSAAYADDHRGASSEGYVGAVTRSGKALDTLYINGGGEPSSLDPQRGADNVSVGLIHAMFEGLTTYGPEDLRPVQGVARSYARSDDGRRYRFHLRPEARWSDGRPVTARDFEYAWKRAIRPETASVVAPSFYPIKNAEAFHDGKITDDSLVGVRARDDLTLDVELERPTPYFLDLTCRPAFSPVREDVVEPFARRGEPDLWVRPESIVVNGPYTLETWRFRYEITMKQNPYYFARDTLKIRRIVWTEADESHAAMNLYKAADLDCLGSGTSIPPSYLPLLEGKKDLRRFPMLAVHWYDFNTRVPPLDDVRVRRALDLAVDRRAIVDALIHGATPAYHYVPEITGGGYAEQVAADRRAGIDPFPERPPAPERARALLREAGYEVVKEGDGLRAIGFPSIEILYNSEARTFQEIAVAVEDMWRRNLGVTATLRVEEWKVMISDHRSGHFQVMRDGWLADYNHPETFLGTFHSRSPDNATGWADAAFDALLDRAEHAADPAESIQLYRQAEARALEGMSRMPLFFASAATLIKPWVKGFRGNGQILDLVRWMWIDPEWRTSRADVPAAAALELPPPERLAP